MFIQENSWQKLLASEFEKPYFLELMQQVEQEYATKTCFPRKEFIFNAFEKCSFQDLKVVIIGQDPYHGEVNGKCEANGLCFSVEDEIPIPPSLKNIFTEINSEYDRIFFPTSGNLEGWANHGILLLNSSLTVRKDQANSHKHLKWNVFTDAVIQKISEEKEHIVFLLWGGFAQKKGSKIDRSKHLVLESGHPSPLSANRGFWFGNQHFKDTNLYLKRNGISEIEW
jgi:uracil-DNA glycosylase